MCLCLEGKPLNCNQIQGLLDDYNANQLPGFKVTWVAQHLGGCPSCRAQTEQNRLKPIPLASAAHWYVEDTRQKPSPARRGLIPPVLFVLILCATLPMLVAQHSDRSKSVMARSQRLRYESSVQAQRGISATLTQLARTGGAVTAVLRFNGQGLVPPDHFENWITVVDSQGRTGDTAVQDLTLDQESMTITFRFTLTPDENQFSIRIGGVQVEVSERWSVQLPRPMNGLGGGGVRLLGNPVGVWLVAYGLVGDMLVLHLRAPLASGRLIGSRFDLLDSAGTQIGPSMLQETSGPEEHAVWIHYPVPRVTHLPLSLVGTRFSQREIGPWYLSISLVP